MCERERESACVYEIEECQAVLTGSSDAKDENTRLMDDVKKLSKKVHVGLKRKSASLVTMGTEYTCMGAVII